MEMIIKKKVIETEWFVTPAATNERRRIARRHSAYCSVKREAHFGYSLEGSWMIICIATRVPCVLDHLTKHFRRELIMS